MKKLRKRLKFFFKFYYRTTNIFRTAKAKRLLSAGDRELINVNIGSGRSYKEGWFNVDLDPQVKVDFRCDVTKKMPFEKNSVDYIYNEHFIEHLSYEDGLEFMKEALRILKPGGVLRMSYPDLDLLVNSYVNDTWREMDWYQRIRSARKCPSRGYMINANMRAGGEHKYIYNSEDMRRQLETAGFAAEKIGFPGIGVSTHKVFQGIEYRGDSGVVEVQK